MPRSISPQVLKELRAEKRWSLDDLAKRTKINRTTLHRIEQGKIANQRQSTLDRLCKALDVEEKVLTGKKPRLRSEASESWIFKRLQQFNMRIESSARNALTLVSRRYGIPATEIIEAAPLLFFLAAERSLRHRRQALSNASDAMRGVVEEAGRALQHLPPYAFAPSSDNVLLDAEKRSIDKRDLFGREVDESSFADRDSDYDTYAHNPFATFLRRELAELSPEAVLSLWQHPVGPHYRICEDEALSIVGGDQDAAEAILDGAAPLNELPKELKDATPEQRAKWAKETRSRLSEEMFGKLDV